MSAERRKPKQNGRDEMIAIDVANGDYADWYWLGYYDATVQFSEQPPGMTEKQRAVYLDGYNDGRRDNGEY